MMMVDPDNRKPKKISMLFDKLSISLILIDVAPVCETLFQIIYVEPGSPDVDDVFALKLKKAFD
jgi:hypothetical protein